MWQAGVINLPAIFRLIQIYKTIRACWGYHSCIEGLKKLNTLLY